MCIRDRATATPAAAAPRVVADGALGWAGFGDEGIIHHTLIGAAWRGYVTRRISLGPEVQFMSGPGSDRDLILTGNVMVDLLAPTASRPRRTTPFVVLGGGLFRHTQRFLTGTSASTEGAFTLGAGMRTWVNERATCPTRRPGPSGRSAAATKSRPRRLWPSGAPGEAPPMIWSIRATSSTVRPIGPATEIVSHTQSTGCCGTSPGDGRSPTMPQKAAGMRSEPPRSVPSARAIMPVASAAAPPPVEPPEAVSYTHLTLPTNREV